MAMIERGHLTSYQEGAMAEGSRPSGRLVKDLARLQLCYETAIRELETALREFLEHQKIA